MQMNKIKNAARTNNCKARFRRPLLFAERDGALNLSGVGRVSDITKY